MTILFNQTVRGRHHMADKSIKIIGIFALLLWLSPAVFSYEPSYNEILIKRKRLESFCRLADNQRKYDICEKFKLMKGKLPDRISEIEAFRKIHGQKAE